MTEEEKQVQLEVLQLADKFIGLANEMNMTDRKELWKVGAAFRFAAARYSSHESAVGSKDLLKDRDELENWFSSQFKTMLIENMQQQIEMIREGKGPVPEEDAPKPPPSVRAAQKPQEPKPAEDAKRVPPPTNIMA